MYRLQLTISQEGRARLSLCPAIAGISLFCITFAGRILNARILNLELFIARRLLYGKGKNTVSTPIVKIAVGGIALGICVMLLSVFVIMGFKQEITDKLSGFVAHVDVSVYGNQPLRASDTLLSLLKNDQLVKSATPYVVKPAILKSPSEIHGIVLRGVDSLYRSPFYARHLKEGRFPDFSGSRASGEVLLSASVANLLKVGLGDKVTAYFVQEPVRARVFVIAGIYDTGFKEYDDMMVLCDIRHLQRLNGWQNKEVSGIALELFDLKDIPVASVGIEERLSEEMEGEAYCVGTLYSMAPQVFDWLSLLNMNVVVILTLIIVVAGFNMVSGLLILILDKTALIGILKTLGARNVSLRRLFLYMAGGLVVRGMLIGNVLAFGLAGLQYAFHIVSLDPEMYYMETVPIVFNIGVILLLNVGVLLLSVVMLLVPAMLISGIRPIKVLRFE